MAERQQTAARKSTKKFELLGKKELAVSLPLPLLEVWEELQPQVEHLTGMAGLQIIRAVIEAEVTRRVGPRYRPGAESAGVRWGQPSGQVVFGGQKVAVTRPRVRRREGAAEELSSYARLQQDGRRQRAAHEGIVAGRTSRNQHRAVESVLDGYGIEKSSVSREFVAASAAQLKTLCERKLDGLDRVANLIDRIPLGQQVLVALGIETSGKKHVLGLPGDDDRRIRNAQAMTGYAEAKAELEKIFRQLERVNPSATRSLEEGMEETLTVHRLGVGELLRRSLATTRPIESCLPRWNESPGT